MYKIYNFVSFCIGMQVPNVLLAYLHVNELSMYELVFLRVFCMHIYGMYTRIQMHACVGPS